MGSIFNWHQCRRVGGGGERGGWKLTGEMGGKSLVPTPAPQVTETQAQRMAHAGQHHPPRPCWAAEKGWGLLGCQNTWRAEVGFTSSFAPECTPGGEKSPGAPQRAHDPCECQLCSPGFSSWRSQDVSPQSTPEVQHLMSPLPEVLLGKMYWWYWLDWGCGKTGYRGV